MYVSLGCGLQDVSARMSVVIVLSDQAIRHSGEKRDHCLSLFFFFLVLDKGAHRGVWPELRVGKDKSLTSGFSSPYCFIPPSSLS